MERTSFLDTEKFKEVNEIYADALEVYMKELREEPRSLRKFLGASDERSDFF